MAGSGLPDYKLTIGELFPADDLVAQWVFTLTSLAEDLTILMSRLKAEQMEERLREQMLFYRLVISRLLEARRLVDAWREHAEINGFTGGKLAFGPLDLTAAYARPGEHERSQVEQLLLDSRNRTTHYTKIGKPEIAGLLRDYERFPARMVISEARGAIESEYQWVTAIRVQDTIGTPPWAPGIVQHLEGFGRSIGSLAVAWIMLSNVCLMIYARRRGIALERIVDDPHKLEEMLDRHRGKADGESVPPASGEPSPA
ncbi:MAG: hypothetical protein WCB67_12120 [Solirubrobacteraceae bacterium]